jgi:hypothetical protein
MVMKMSCIIHAAIKGEVINSAQIRSHKARVFSAPSRTINKGWPKPTSIVIRNKNYHFKVATRKPIHNISCSMHLI